MRTWSYFNRRKQKKMLRVIQKYLEHKGESGKFIFTTQLFDEPKYRVRGFNIAVRKENNLTFYSLIKCLD